MIENTFFNIENSYVQFPSFQIPFQILLTPIQFHFFLWTPPRLMAYYILPYDHWANFDL